MYDDSDYDYGIPERKPTSPRDERAGTFFGDLKRAMKQVHRTGAFAACGHDSGLPAPVRCTCFIARLRSPKKVPARSSRGEVGFRSGIP